VEESSRRNVPDELEDFLLATMAFSLLKLVFMPKDKVDLASSSHL